MNLFIILLIVVTFFLLLIKLIASLMGRVSERMLTQYFRSIDALFAQNALPEDWTKQLKKLAQARRVIRKNQPWEVEAKAFLLKKTYKLRKFFETCRFVDSEEARALLLTQIDNLTERWEQSELSEIFAYYKFNIDVDKELRDQNLSVQEVKL